jgi:predicted transposase YbfD/YdcC|tara:strand:- start:23 stop:1156 length:1134 start_codon:yes stop_codon:yes gene_type:complete
MFPEQILEAGTMSNTTSFQSVMSGLPDPRQSGKVVYPLDEILLLSLCGTISGCESFVDIAEYGEEKLTFLRELAPFKDGVPSHDTLCAVFRQLDPAAFSEAFSNWAQGLAQRLSGSVVAIDGKTVRGSKSRNGDALHVISAFCDDLRLVLGQRPSDHKKNEIRDIPHLLDMLYLEGCIVTLDAMGCQTAIAQKIKDRKADYVLALKGNQGTLHSDVKLWFEDKGCENSQFFQSVDGDKGRIETRDYWICDQIDWLTERHPDWAGLRSIGRVTSQREINGKTSNQTRYFITSLPADAPTFAGAVRSHWGIENRLHWVLDVVFGDDHCRVRADQAPKNFTVIKHMAMNLLNRAKQKKSLRLMRKKAGWNNQFLKSIISA